MIDLTDAKAVEEALESFEIATVYEEKTYYDSGWDALDEALDGFRGKHTLEIPELGTVELLSEDSYTGREGGQEDTYMIFQVTQNSVLQNARGNLAVSARYKKEGYYASYDGTNWDGDFFRVKPQPKTITEYVRWGA